MKHRLWVIFVGLCVILGVGISTTQAQTNLTWTAQYFNNTSLSGSPVTTTALSSINLNWGKGSPVNGVGTDDWTARFNTVTSFQAGTYRFTINADDAFKLYIHNGLVLETFSNPQPNRTMTVDYTFTDGLAGVQVDYREYIGDAFLSLSWQRISPNVNVPPVPSNGTWLAQFYNNTSLTGSPAAATIVNSLNLNWGRSAPASGVLVDDWTARFNTITNLSAGTYRFDINADDAFKLFVNNQLVLETFSNPQPNKWLSTDVTLSGGNVGIQVDYREYIGDAFITVSWKRIDAPVVTPTPLPQPPTDPTLLVNTNRLNVRSAPFMANNILTQVQRSERYPLLGRTAASDWYLIRVGQTNGWVSARYVIPFNANNVPVVAPPVDPPPTVAPTGFTLRPTVNLSLRSGPDTTFQRMTVIPANRTVSIVGRNRNNTWWQVVYDDRVGWVSGRYSALSTDVDTTRIPING